MTAQTDLDGKLRAWLDLMPDEAPDHAVSAVLLAVEASPQSRAAFRWPTWRPLTMNRLFAAVGAMAIVAVVGVLLLTGQGQQATVGTSPSPAASAASVASSPPSPSTPVNASAQVLAVVPAQLQHRWMGAGTAGISRLGAGTSLLFAANSLTMNEAASNQSPGLTATVGTGSGNQLVVVADGQQPRCDTAIHGTYAWSMSPSGRVLTLTGQDACAVRGGALPGTWWRVDCKDPTDNCLGPLDPGTYKSQFVSFDHPGGSSWAPVYGAVTYTVPDGWANDADWPQSLSLTTQSAYASWTQGAGSSEWLGILPAAAAESQATPCSGKSATGVGTRPSDIVASLRSVAGLVTGPSTPVTIDGRSGLAVDLALNEARVRPCGTDRVAEYLVSGTGSNMNAQAVVPGHRNRLILLPDPRGTIAIIVDAPTSAFDAFASQAMSVVQSMHFQ